MLVNRLLGFLLVLAMGTYAVAVRAQFIGTSPSGTVESGFIHNLTPMPLQSVAPSIMAGTGSFEYLHDFQFPVSLTPGLLFFDFDATSIHVRLNAGCSSCDPLGGISFEPNATFRVIFEDALGQLPDILDVRLTVDDERLSLAQRTSFTTDSITFGFSGLSGPGDEPDFPSAVAREWDFQVTFAQPAAPIPEPESYALLLAGLGLLGFEARRRRKLQRAAA